MNHTPKWELDGGTFYLDSTICHLDIVLDALNKSTQLEANLAKCKEAAHWADDMRKNYKQQLNDALAQNTELLEALEAIRSTVICNGDMSIAYAIDSEVGKKMLEAIRKARE